MIKVLGLILLFSLSPQNKVASAVVIGKQKIVDNLLASVGVNAGYGNIDLHRRVIPKLHRGAVGIKGLIGEDTANLIDSTEWHRAFDNASFFVKCRDSVDNLDLLCGGLTEVNQANSEHPSIAPSTLENNFSRGTEHMGPELQVANLAGDIDRPIRCFVSRNGLIKCHADVENTYGRNENTETARDHHPEGPPSHIGLLLKIVFGATAFLGGLYYFILAFRDSSSIEARAFDSNAILGAAGICVGGMFLAGVLAGYL